MRLLLVDNLLVPDQGAIAGLDLHPHLGLLSLVAVAAAGGHDAAIWDPKLALSRGELEYDARVYDRAARALLEQEPDAIGFTTLGCTFIFALQTARRLERMKPALPILLGGPHATILDREILSRFPEFDVVVRHEAEDTLLPVLDRLACGRFDGIPGVSWRDGCTVVSNPGVPTVRDLDRLPLPAYERYPIEELGLDVLRIDAGRGCPFMCTFCSTASFFGRSYRLKSPARLLHEMDTLNARYGVTDFRLNHDLFTVSKAKVRGFCAAVMERRYTWGVSARIDCVDEDLLHTMWRAGCRRIYFGIETGSRRMQQVSEKRMDLDLFQPTLDVAERLGMSSVVSFIAGYPQEREADLEDTLDALGTCFRRSGQVVETQLHMLTPEPGTKLYQEFGDRLLYDGYIGPYNACRLHEEDEGIIRSHPGVFVTYYYYPTVLRREEHRLAVEAYRVLRECGHDLLAYILGFYEERFSTLIRRVRDWSNATNRRDSVDARFAIDFFRADLGEEHHVASLVAFKLLADPDGRILPRGTSAPDAAAFDPDTVYRIAPHVLVFPRIHTCPPLLDRIRQRSGRITHAEAGEPGCHMVVPRRAEHDRVRDVTLDSQAGVVLRLFSTPHSCRTLGAILGFDAAPGLPLFEIVRELVAAGGLRPA